MSNIVYNLGGAYATFLSDVGVDDEIAGNGAVDFQVLADGVAVYDSGVLTKTSPVAHINLNVTGVQQLTLFATNGIAGTIDYDHADWAGARVLTAAATGAATGAVTPTLSAFNTATAINSLDSVSLKEKIVVPKLNSMIR